MMDPLRDALHELAETATATDGRLTRVRRAVRNRRAAQVAAMVGIAGIGVATVSIPRSGEHSSSLEGSNSGSGSYVICDDAKVPLEQLSKNGTEETNPGEPQDALRAAFETIRIGSGVSKFGQGHWVELARTDSTVTYGQRTELIGVGEVVTVQRNSDGKWKYTTSGNCGPIQLADGLSTQPVLSYRKSEGRLLLSWEGGGCRGAEGPHDDVLVRVESQMKADGLHVQIITHRNPAAEQAGGCAGVGLPETAELDPPEPIADTAIWDDSHVPPIRIGTS